MGWQNLGPIALPRAQAPPGPSGPTGPQGPQGTGSLPWVNVTDARYSADPTGATNSTTRLQNALNAAATAGGVLFLPPGTFSIDGALTVPDGVRAMLGDGATIRVANGANIGDWGIINVWSPNCTLSGFTFDGNVTNQAIQQNYQASGFLIRAGAVTLRNLRVFNTVGSAIISFQATETVVEHCLVENAGQVGRNALDLDAHGISMSGPSPEGTSRWRISNNRISNARSAGIVGLSHGGVCEGNVITGTNCFGIAIGAGPPSEVVVSHNYIRIDVTSASLGIEGCIDIADISYCTVVGNVCMGALGGIVNRGPSFQCTIVGNVCGECHGHGIYVTSYAHEPYPTTDIPMNCVVNGNVIYKCGMVGIFLGRQTDMVVSNNVVMNNGQDTWGPGITSDGGQHIVFTGNRVGDNQSVKTQEYAMYFPPTPMSDVLIVGNDLKGNAWGDISFHDPNIAGPADVTVANNLLDTP